MAKKAKLKDGRQKYTIEERDEVMNSIDRLRSEGYSIRNAVEKLGLEDKWRGLYTYHDRQRRGHSRSKNPKRGRGGPETSVKLVAAKVYGETIKENDDVVSLVGSRREIEELMRLAEVGKKVEATLSR